MQPDTVQPTPSALPTGTRLAEFELLRVLGVGGFSIVYLALDHALQREVAIKEYLPTAIAGRGADGTVVVQDPAEQDTFDLGLRSFINEARLLARFDHPALLKVYRFWEGQRTAYMTMPLIRGDNLRIVHKRRARAPDEAWLQTLLGPLLGALATLHAEGVVHRDVAPDNIVVGDNGAPMLLDFGAARRVISDRSQAITTILKPSYAPIEQYGESPSLRQGPWTDLYALGATLHFLLLGRPPMAAASRAVHDDQPPLAQQALPGCSPAFLGLVDWMLALRPDARPQNVQALAARLQALPGWGDVALPKAARERLQVVDPPPLDPSDVAYSRSYGSRDSTASAPAARGTGLFAWLLAAFKPAPVQTDAQTDTQTDAQTDAQADAPANHHTVVLRQPGPAAAKTLAADDAALADRTLMIPATRQAGGGPSTLPVLPAMALTIVKSDTAAHLGRSWPLADGDTVLGRDGADLSLPDPLWSRRHALVRASAGHLSLTDLDSANGSFVNGHRIPPQQGFALHLGASIRLGGTVFALTLRNSRQLPDLTGHVLQGRYRLCECLHDSPKGVLYRAEKLGSGLPVAIKLLSPDYAAFADYRARFAEEATIAARLQHPHICRLDDHGELSLEDGTAVPFVAYQIMGGGNLAARLPGMAGVATELIARWIDQLADALHHAHCHQVVHGNLKPSAVCFDESAHVYLTDFAVLASASASASGGQAVLGAPAFMAPEQWLLQAPTPASDQYALAVLAYLLLTGTRPYEGQEDPDTRERNLRQSPPPLHREARLRAQRELPPALTAVVDQALAREPTARHAGLPAFANAFARALRSAGRGRGTRDVFFSYQRDSSAGWVTHLSLQLQEKHQISSYVDTQGLDGAVKFPERIQHAIEQCGVFICLLGPQTLQSPHVLQEIELAHAQGKPMIPVFQEGFAVADPVALQPGVRSLLQFDGIHLLDKRNIYIDQAVVEIAKQVRSTLAGGEA